MRVPPVARELVCDLRDEDACEHEDRRQRREPERNQRERNGGRRGAQDDVSIEVLGGVTSSTTANPAIVIARPAQTTQAVPS